MKTSVQLAMHFGILLAFQNLQEANFVFKMAASIGLLEVRILTVRFSAITSFIYIQCSPGLNQISWFMIACISDSHSFNVAVPVERL